MEEMCEDSGDCAEYEKEDACPLNVKRLGIDYPVAPDQEEIVLQSARIACIENISECRQLKKLALVANEVSAIENLEDNAATLEHLELYQNRIHAITNVDMLVNLRVLDLSFNKISKIENLSPLVHLKELYLSSNRISKIEGLETLTDLELLELGSNRIRVIEGIDNLTRLKALWLGKNKITKLDLPSLPAIERLSVQSNRLTDWGAKLFENCQSLKELYISHNKLTAPPREMEKLSELVILDLGSNEINHVDYVRNMINLQDLWLNDNKIENVDALASLHTLPALQTLYAERNPIQMTLGPGYRQALLDIVPKIIQIDALMLNASVKIIERPLSGKVGVITKPKPSMKHDT